MVWRNHLGLDAAHGQGVLITAGDMLFIGQPDGMLYGLDAVDGKTLWKFQTDGDIEGAVTYTINGEQYVWRSVARRQAVGVQARRQLQEGVGQQRDADAGAVRRCGVRSAAPRRGSTVGHGAPGASERHRRPPTRRRHRDRRDEPDDMTVPVGTTVTFLNPGTETFAAELPNTKLHCATQFFEGLFNPKLNPGQSFQYTFTKEGEYFYNDCTDPRPTGKVVASRPAGRAGSLQFVPSMLNMRPANGVFTSVQGLVTVMFKVPAGYTLDGNVQLRRRCRRRCSPRSPPT